MDLYKESKYNIVIKSNNKSVLLYNTVSGAVCNFELSVYNTFFNKDKISADDLLTDIIRLGFVVPQSFNEVSELEKCKHNYIYNQEPDSLSYVIAPTLACNYNCDYCFEKNSRSARFMNGEVLEKTVSFIKQQFKKYSEAKRLYILWFGGEPCLCKEIITKLSSSLIDFTKKNNIKYDSFMVTNGSLLSSEIAVHYKEKCGIQGVQISLDGLKERYSKYRKCSDLLFDKVIHNIISLTKIWLIHLRFNIDRNNVDEINSLIDIILSSDINKENLHIYFAPTKDYSGTDGYALSGADFESIRNSLIDRIVEGGDAKVLKLSLPAKVACGCGSMRNYTCVIGPEGELYRCEHCLGNPKYIIGTVTDGFYHNEIDSAFLDLPTPTKCLDCNLLPICAQGCRADILLHNIVFDCDSYRKRIINNVLRSVYLKNKNMQFEYSPESQDLC